MTSLTRVTQDPSRILTTLGDFAGVLSASAFVFASDSPLKIRAAARLAKVFLGNRIQICDGVADEKEIQAAIDFLAATGGTAHLSVGTFTLSDELQIFISNITISGEGSATIIKAKNAYAGFYDGTYMMLAVYGTSGTPISNVTLKQFYLDGNQANIALNIETVRTKYVDNLVIEDVYYANAYYIGFTLDVGTKKVFLSRCHFSGNVIGATGCYIFTYVGNDIVLRVDDCDFDTVKNQAFYIAVGQVFASHCYMKDCNHGFDVRSGAYGTLVDSVIDGGTSYALKFLGDRSTARNVRVVNTLNTTNATVVLFTGNENTLDNVTLISPDDTTARNMITFSGSSSRNKIINSYIYGSKLSDNGAVLVNFGSNTAVDNIVENNTLLHSFFAFRNGTGNNYVRRNNVSDYNYYLCNLSFASKTSLPNFIEGDGVSYIAQGEQREVSGILTAGVANAIAFAWHNPEGQDILIKKVTVEITTGSVTANSVIDVGIADDAAGTNRGTEFFNDLDANDVDINDSWVAGDGGTQTKWVFCQDLVSATDGWVVGQILVADAAALVGKYYIEYGGR